MIPLQVISRSERLSSQGDTDVVMLRCKLQFEERTMQVVTIFPTFEITMPVRPFPLSRILLDTDTYSPPQL